MKNIFKLEMIILKKRESYNTKQKDIIFDVIKKQNKEFTVKDIYSEIKDVAGLTTIYRFIDKLVDDGILNKSIGKDNVTYYSYLEECNEENHFYLKCNSCGNMTHIDCECIGDLTNHINKEHKFKPFKEHIIINGICDKCLRKER